MIVDEWSSKLCKYYPCDPYKLHYCEKEHTTGRWKCFNDPGCEKCEDYEGEE
jgi:hypothetical protein